MQKKIELSVLPLLCVRSLLVSLPKTSLVLPSQCRLSRTRQRDSNLRPVLAGPKTYTSWSGLLHTCTILFVSLSSLLPHSVPCSQPSHFFFLLSPTFCPSFRVIWWNQTLFLGGPRSPLTRSAPPIISPIPTSNNPPAKPCLSCVVPSLSAVFQKFDPPF